MRWSYVEAGDDEIQREVHQSQRSLGLDPDLKLKVEAVTGPQLDHHQCRPLPLIQQDGGSCSHKYTWTNNYNKIMVIDYVHQYLITCGTLFQGICEKRHLSNISTMEPPNYTTYVVNVNQTSSTLAFIAPGPTDDPSQPDEVNVLYVAETFLKNWLYSSIPPLCSRKLSDFTLAYKNRDFYEESRLIFDKTHRNIFLVNYVYGFSSAGYSFFLARQPREIPAKEYHSVLIRLCQKDKAYRSYTEVPLVCRTKDGTYNQLQAASVGTAGRKLALSLGVSLPSKVIYAVFSSGQVTSSRSALCVYSLDSVNRVITDAWKACFNGEGDYGGVHLKGYKSCTKNTELAITEKYCGEVKTNNPLAIPDPIVADALVTFPEVPNRVITALGVSITHEYTVAFAGTSDGHVSKVSVDSNTSANMYETVPIASGEAFKSDVAFDEEGEHLYLLTETKVSTILHVW
ncbi:plexin A [Elysia marginata]|uniref:Plexin A n=1 Tax=Elysia marginata TaxID=1093978 RepID=A0AAV4IYG1_9GAST|nr:plexin A [Elysia marginata]